MESNSTSSEPSSPAYLRLLQKNSAVYSTLLKKVTRADTAARKKAQSPAVVTPSRREKTWSMTMRSDRGVKAVKPLQAQAATLKRGTGGSHHLCFEKLCMESPAIGEGFFGTVYKARHPSLDLDLACKVLKAGGMEAKLEFLKEVKMLQTLVHPNLLPMIDCFVNSGNLYLVTPFMPKGSLGSVLKNHKSPADFAWGVRISIALDVAKGMEYLHSQHIVHRDLKADNVLLSEEMRAVVADFGLAEEFGPQRRLQQGGTWSIMAPEVLQDKPYDERCDIFSFGILLCELGTRLLSKDVPRTDDFGVSVQQMQEEKVLDEGCPKRLMDLITACCCIEPADRPPFASIVVTLGALTLKAHDGWDALGFKALKRECQVRALSDTGNKQELVKRLSLAAVSVSPAILGPPSNKRAHPIHEHPLLISPELRNQLCSAHLFEGGCLGTAQSPLRYICSVPDCEFVLCLNCFGDKRPRVQVALAVGAVQKVRQHFETLGVRTESKRLLFENSPVPSTSDAGSPFTSPTLLTQTHSHSNTSTSTSASSSSSSLPSSASPPLVSVSSPSITPSTLSASFAQSISSLLTPGGFRIKRTPPPALNILPTHHEKKLSPLLSQIATHPPLYSSSHTSSNNSGSSDSADDNHRRSWDSPHRSLSHYETPTSKPRSSFSNSSSFQQETSPRSSRRRQSDEEEEEENDLEPRRLIRVKSDGDVTKHTTHARSPDSSRQRSAEGEIHLNNSPSRRRGSNSSQGSNSSEGAGGSGSNSSNGGGRSSNGGSSGGGRRALLCRAASCSCVTSSNRRNSDSSSSSSGSSSCSSKSGGSSSRSSDGSSSSSSSSSSSGSNSNNDNGNSSSSCGPGCLFRSTSCNSMSLEESQPHMIYNLSQSPSSLSRRRSSVAWDLPEHISPSSRGMYRPSLSALPPSGIRKSVTGYTAPNNTSTYTSAFSFDVNSFLQQQQRKLANSKAIYSSCGGCTGGRRSRSVDFATCQHSGSYNKNSVNHEENNVVSIHTSRSSSGNDDHSEKNSCSHHSSNSSSADTGSSSNGSSSSSSSSGSGNSSSSGSDEGSGSDGGGACSSCSTGRRDSAKEPASGISENGDFIFNSRRESVDSQSVSPRRRNSFSGSSSAKDSDSINNTLRRRNSDIIYSGRTRHNSGSLAATEGRPLIKIEATSRARSKSSDPYSLAFPEAAVARTVSAPNMSLTVDNRASTPPLSPRRALKRGPVYIRISPSGQWSETGQGTKLVEMEARLFADRLSLAPSFTPTKPVFFAPVSPTAPKTGLFLPQTITLSLARCSVEVDAVPSTRNSQEMQSEKANLASLCWFRMREAKEGGDRVLLLGCQKESDLKQWVAAIENARDTGGPRRFLEDTDSVVSLMRSLQLQEASTTILATVPTPRLIPLKGALESDSQAIRRQLISLQSQLERNQAWIGQLSTLIETPKLLGAPTTPETSMTFSSPLDTTPSPSPLKEIVLDRVLPSLPSPLSSTSVLPSPAIADEVCPSLDSLISSISPDLDETMIPAPLTLTPRTPSSPTPISPKAPTPLAKRILSNMLETCELYAETET